MTDALPDTDRALTFDERMAVACEWSDYRKEYGVPAQGMSTAHKAFVAGWRARHLHGYTPDVSECAVPHPSIRGVACSLEPGHSGDHVDAGAVLAGQWSHSTVQDHGNGSDDRG